MVRTSTCKFRGDTIQSITVCETRKRYPIYRAPYPEKHGAWGGIYSVAFSWQLGWKVQEVLLCRSGTSVLLHWPLSFPSLPPSLPPSLSLFLSLSLSLSLSPSLSWASSQHGGFLHGGWLPRRSTPERVNAEASNLRSYTAAGQLHSAFQSQSWGQPGFKGRGKKTPPRA